MQPRTLAVYSRMALPAIAALGIAFSAPAAAQDAIRVGEINSYKAQPAFLDP